MYVVIMVGTQKQTTSYTCYCHLSVTTCIFVCLSNFCQVDIVEDAAVGQGAAEAIPFCHQDRLVDCVPQ